MHCRIFEGVSTACRQMSTNMKGYCTSFDMRKQFLPTRGFGRRMARNNPQSTSETSGMMPNFAGVEKFFAQMTFKTVGTAGTGSRHKRVCLALPRETIRLGRADPNGA